MTLVAVFWPFIVELTAVRLLGLLAGANFLALQFGMLLSLLKNSMVRHVLQPRAKSRRSLLRERHEVSTVTRF
ncbi:hypothetical protein [Agrobacterium rubi]|uniref:hypothetical protein n=1 Tax=Agrobacterium rubi TaxID=28099 RepID=UPI001572B60E|nr:hypothetical protein [Agrobacterium rubi]NTF10875.1 hypothetical protein [Agrobacterium rubi]